MAKDEEKVNQLYEETIQKVFNIFCARSETLFADDDELMWLREIIGFVLTQLDNEESELNETRQIMIAQLQSGIVDIHFTWSRYRLSLKTADFMDDLRIIAPEDLMGGGNQPGMDQFGGGPPGMGQDNGMDMEGNQEQNNIQN